MTHLLERGAALAHRVLDVLADPGKEKKEK